MNPDLISERVLATVRQELDLEPSELNLADSRDSVEFWDSLGHLRVCLAIEAEFDIGIPMDVVASLDSISAIVAFLLSELN